VCLNVSGDLRNHVPNMLAVAARLHPPFLRLLKPDLLVMHTLPAFNGHFPTKASESTTIEPDLDRSIAEIREQIIVFPELNKIYQIVRIKRC
jgi:hypothetical protein